MDNLLGWIARLKAIRPCKKTPLNSDPNKDDLTENIPLVDLPPNCVHDPRQYLTNYCNLIYESIAAAEQRAMKRQNRTRPLSPDFLFVVGPRSQFERCLFNCAHRGTQRIEHEAKTMGIANDILCSALRAYCDGDLNNSFIVMDTELIEAFATANAMNRRYPKLDICIGIVDYKKLASKPLVSCNFLYHSLLKLRGAERLNSKVLTWGMIPNDSVTHLWSWKKIMQSTVAQDWFPRLGYDGLEWNELTSKRSPDWFVNPDFNFATK